MSEVRKRPLQPLNRPIVVPEVPGGQIPAEHRTDVVSWVRDGLLRLQHGLDRLLRLLRRAARVVAHLVPELRDRAPVKILQRTFLD